MMTICTGELASEFRALRIYHVIVNILLLAVLMHTSVTIAIPVLIVLVTEH